MQTLFKKNTLAIIAAASAAAFSANAWSDYSFSSIPLGDNTTAAFDMEAGKVAKIDNSLLGTKIVLINGSTSITLEDNANFKSNVSLSNGTVFWTEQTAFNSQTSTATIELFSGVNGVTSQLTNTGNEKLGLTTHSGKAAWVENVGGTYQLFYYDGVNIQVLNTAGIQLSANPLLMLDGNAIAFIATVGVGTQGAIKEIFSYDGFRFNQVTHGSVSVTSAALSNGVFAYVDASFKHLPSTVKKFENGVSSIISPSNGTGGYLNPIIENGTIVWTQLTSQFTDQRNLFVYKNGQVTQLSQSAINNPRMANGKILWTEGSNGLPSRVMQNVNGQTVQVKAAANPIGLDISGSYISFRENGTNGAAPALTLGSPVTAVDLGLSTSGKKRIDLSQGNVTVKISQFVNPGFNARHVGFGFTSGDGLALDGIRVQDVSGISYPLNGWWASVVQTFSWQPVTLEIKQANRKINIEWWYQG